MKRSRVGERYQADVPLLNRDGTMPRAHDATTGHTRRSSSLDASANSTSSRAADSSSRDDVCVFDPSAAGAEPEALRDYLKQASELWSLHRGLNGANSPAKSRGKGKYGVPKRPPSFVGGLRIEPASQEAALCILHDHKYDASAALAALEARQPPVPLCASWPAEEKSLFDALLSLRGKDFTAISAAFPRTGGKPSRTPSGSDGLVRYFYERKCRAALEAGRPSFLDARPIVTCSQRRGPPGGEPRAGGWAIAQMAATAVHAPRGGPA